MCLHNAQGFTPMEIIKIISIITICYPNVLVEYGSMRWVSSLVKANILKNLQALGIDLDDESMRKVTDRIIELGDKKQMVTSDDLPYIIADILRQDVQENKVHILNYNLSLGQGLHPVATLKIRINDADYEETASGDGQYDAFMKALRRIYKDHLHRDFPMLTNYAVTIPPGGRTDAFVQTFISWEYRGQSFKTLLVLDADQTEAAIKGDS